MAKKKNPAAAAARTSGATGLRPMSRARFGGAGPSLRDTDEALAQQVARKGLHPIEVARRIIARMPEAWSVVPAQVRDVVPVTTGYNTHWEYRLNKAADGWTATFTPQDLDARRRTGGKVGGFLGPTGISARPYVYRTKTEAYEAVSKHAAKGQYLLQKNPAGTVYEVVSDDFETDQTFSHGTYRSLERAEDAADMLRREFRRMAASMYGGDSPLMVRVVRRGARANPAPRRNGGLSPSTKVVVRYEGADGRGRKESATWSDVKALVLSSRAASVYYRGAFRKLLLSDAADYIEMTLMGPTLGAEFDLHDGNTSTRYDVRLEPTETSDVRTKKRRNPSDWALAYEGRLRDLTGESDGLIRVQMNRGLAASTKLTVNYSGVDDYDSEFDGTMVKTWSSVKSYILSAESDSGHKPVTVTVKDRGSYVDKTPAEAARFVESALKGPARGADFTLYDGSAYVHYNISRA